jgi:hypothetical protein
MRLLLAVAMLLLPFYAAAQTGPTPFTPTTVYDPPPSSVETPRAWDLESVRAARGNLGRWRDQERQRLGPARFDSETRTTRNAIASVGGYFAFFGDGQLPGGVVEARWDQPAARVGLQGHLWARYTHQRLICEATLQSAYSDISELTYLGAQWLPEFDALDAALVAEAPAPIGRNLAEGASVQFISPPDFSRFYPPRAVEREAEGVVEIACLVRDDYRVTCATVSETPEGWDFGYAAQRAMRTVVAQETVNGEPTSGACFTKRVRFLLR